MIVHEVWEAWGTPPDVDNGEDPTLGALKHTARKNGNILRFMDSRPTRLTSRTAGPKRG
jgi:hypothetical protein